YPPAGALSAWRATPLLPSFGPPRRPSPGRPAAPRRIQRRTPYRIHTRRGASGTRVSCLVAVRRFEVASTGYPQRDLCSVIQAARVRGRDSDDLRDDRLAGRRLLRRSDAGG